MQIMFIGQRAARQREEDDMAQCIDNEPRSRTVGPDPKALCLSQREVFALSLAANLWAGQREHHEKNKTPQPPPPGTVEQK